MFSDLGVTFRLFFFTDITSPDDIMACLKEKQPPVCLIDPSTIISPKQIQIAVLNALGFERQGKREAKTIYLEIMRCLSPDARLSGAFKHIAFGSKSKAAIAITFETEMPQVSGLENAKQLSMDEFFDQIKPDLALINKIFRITDDMLKLHSYEEIVTTTLAVAASDLVRTKGVQ